MAKKKSESYDRNGDIKAIIWMGVGACVILLGALAFGLAYGSFNPGR